MINLLDLCFALILFLNFLKLPKEGALFLKSAVNTETVTHAAKNENADLIPWSNNRRLSWDEFLGEPQRNTDAVASTSTSLGLGYQVKNSTLTYQITCDFSKSKSWVLMKTPYILRHEQGHFDITEVYARKLNKALEEYSLNLRTYKQDINTIYTNIVHEKEMLQDQYDAESDHSRNKKSQMQWLTRIDKMLAATQAYAQHS